MTTKPNTIVIQSEYHIHCDIKSKSSKVQEILENFCKTRNLNLVNHDLSLKLDSGFDKLAASAPIQHFDIKPINNSQFTNFTIVQNIADAAMQTLIEQSQNNLKGYTEAEHVFYKDYKLGSHETDPILAPDFFDSIKRTANIKIDINLIYHEFHWTVRASFVSLNLAIFEKANFQTVGFEKDGVKYLVLTTLANYDDCKKLSDIVDKIEFGDWKIEFKRYFSSDMSDWSYRFMELKNS
jgi:hypothetical protein